MNTQSWKWNESDMAYFANAETAGTKSAEALRIKPGRMTHKQVGMILTLADELGEFDKGLEFIKTVRSESDAEGYINELRQRIDKQ